MAECLIALGSNLGDRARLLRGAIGQMAALESTQILSRSDFRPTLPIGGPDGQSQFLNAAVRIATTLEPRRLWEGLRAIERRLGRAAAVRWGPRAIDLDLLLYDRIAVDTSDLVVPHPRMEYRRFVLEPAAEVAPWMVHSPSGWTVGSLLSLLNLQPDLVGVAAVDLQDADRLADQLRDRFGSRQIGFERWQPDSGQEEAAGRPKLILAVAPSSGLDRATCRTMPRLPARGPVAWVNGRSADETLREAIVVVQSAWPHLAMDA